MVNTELSGQVPKGWDATVMLHSLPGRFWWWPWLLEPHVNHSDTYKCDWQLWTCLENVLPCRLFDQPTTLSSIHSINNKHACFQCVWIWTLIYSVCLYWTAAQKHDSSWKSVRPWPCWLYSDSYDPACMFPMTVFLISNLLLVISLLATCSDKLSNTIW